MRQELYFEGLTPGGTWVDWLWEGWLLEDLNLDRTS